MVFVVYGFCKVCFYSSCGTPHVICCCCCKLACLSCHDVSFPVHLSLIRRSRRRGRRRPRLPMRGGSNWLSSVSRLRRLLRRSWDLSWRFLPRSSTEAVCFCASPVLWNIWPLNLSSLVKLCDSVILVVKRVIHHLLRLLFQTFSSRMNRFVCQV